MKRALLYLLFLLFLAGGAAAYYFDDWREIAGNFARDAQQSVKKATAPAPATSKKTVTKKATTEKPVTTASIPDPQKPAFDVVRVDPEGTAIFAGRAEPGWQVRVETKGQTLGQTEADSNGDWIIMVDKPIAKGDHEFKLMARAPDGRRELSAADNVKLAVGIEDKAKEETKVAAAQIVPQPVPEATAKAAEPEPKAAEPVVEPKPAPQEKKEVAALETKPVEQAEKVEVAKEEAPTPAVTKAEPEKEMTQNYEAQTFTEEAKASAPVTPAPSTASDPMTTAAMTASAQATGDVSKQPEQKMAKAEPEVQPEAEPAVTKMTEKVTSRTGNGFVVIRSGDTLWAIAERHYGKGHRYSKIFKGNRGKIRDPHWIYPDQRFKLPK